MKLKTVTGILVLLFIAVVAIGSVVSLSHRDTETAAVQPASHPVAMRPFGGDDFDAPRTGR